MTMYVQVLGDEESLDGIRKCLLRAVKATADAQRDAVQALETVSALLENRAYQRRQAEMRTQTTTAQTGDDQ